MAWAALKRNASRFVQAFNTETRIACRSWTIHWLGWCWPLLLFGVALLASGLNSTVTTTLA
ncbi:hypothetical protein ACG3RS_28460, partial [Pseudomonas aeruginosa]